MSKIKNFKVQKLYTATIFLAVLFLFASCATIKPQYGKKVSPPDESALTPSAEKPVHTFFLVGDAGNADRPKSKETLNLLKKRLDVADSSSTLLFLGDNIYPHGMPAEKDTPERKLAELKLQTQIDIADDFDGYTIFIPGNHDWYSHEGLKEQEKYVRQQLKKKKSFLPRNGCAIDTKKINDDLVIIVIDSEWIIVDWNTVKGMNADCNLKIPEDFYEEFERQLNKNQDKTVIVAVHHPVYTNGTHGGQSSVYKHFFPVNKSVFLPGIGTIINFMRKTSGVIDVDIQNEKYRTFANRLKTIIADREDVIFVSGHDHNLQYIERGNIKQVVSGAGSKSEPARAVKDTDFSYGGLGYALIEAYENGRSLVKFYGNENGKEVFLFEKEIHKGVQPHEMVYEKDFPETAKAQIYEDELTRKSWFYRFLFGEHYRNYYSMPVEAPTLNLDTYLSGLTPLRKGGGHQTNSVRLVDSDGKQYVMRALRKSATRFIQGVMYQELYVEKEFENTFTERFILDFYTSANPYYPFIIGELADPIGVYHTNPKLFYVSKQNALQHFNDDFDEGLYMLEERPMKRYTDAEFFGMPEDIISTNDLLEALRSDSNHVVDEELYIRSRLFDMLIGDWDRHEDQWRWGVHNRDGKVVYEPIPRDRDQAFPKYGGALLELLLKITVLSQMQGYDKDIKNVKWFNWEPYPLDMAVITNSELDIWLEQAAYIDEHLTDEIIDASFRNIPKEVDDENVERIKKLLKIRKKNLPDIARKYHRVLAHRAVIYATDKKDRIVVNRMSGGKTNVKMYRIKKSGEELFFDRTYDKKETGEIWVFGLNGEDEIEVKGNPEKPILIRLAGGEGADNYNIETGKKIRIYDYKDEGDDLTQAKKARIFLNNDYKRNRYEYRRLKFDDSSTFPYGGYNPDDGVMLGLYFSYKTFGFVQEPYTSYHNLTANFIFATNGIELDYNAIFANIIGGWKLGLNAYFTTPAFTVNYFGFGNETENFEKDLGMNYNRVKIQTLRFAPSVFKEEPGKGKIEFKLGVEDIKVAKTKGRITETTPDLDQGLFRHNYFGGGGVKYSFENYDNKSLPTLGMTFDLGAYWTSNLRETKKNFAHLEGHLGFTHKITKDETLALNTLAGFKSIFNNKFEFFQAAAVGGDSGLRAYRHERFIGKTSFFHSNDLRLALGNFKKSFIPMRYGIIVGYDYGRVWLNGEDSNKWHQAVGGGFWINGVNMITGGVNYFYGSDKGRISFAVRAGF